MVASTSKTSTFYSANTTSSPSTVGNDAPLSTLKMAQTFYRRTGKRFLHPSIKLSNPYDKEIWLLFFPALVALMMEPMQAFIEFGIVSWHLGTAHLGALGLGTIVFQFALGLFSTFIFATTPIIARHAAEGDIHRASKSTAQGMLIAFFTGILLQITVLFLTDPILSFLSSDPTVSALAEEYLIFRSWGIPAALIMMVAIGAARGHKDMTAQLIGSASYGLALSIFDIVLVFAADSGIRGAGIAASLSQWTGAVAITWLLVHRGHLNTGDIWSAVTDFLASSHVKRQPRTTTTATAAAANQSIAQQAQSLTPYITMAPSLALNSVAALAPMLVSSSLATGLGADQLAAHTVLRQLSGFWLQGFLAFNATSHSMVASSLGAVTQRSKGIEQASDILERICQVAVASSIPAAVFLYWLRSALPAAFTAEAAVVDQVALVLPLLLLFMPLDALGTTLEGGILGASDTRWIAGRTVVSSVLSVAALYAEHGDLVTVWMCLKVVSVAALTFDLVRFMGPVRNAQTSGSKL